MSTLRLAFIAFFAWVGLALAQAPPPVPALPDTPRITSYSLSASNCDCAVNFALYGDSTDYWDWVEVWINGVNAPYNGANAWTVTSPTGPLATIPRPVTDAVLTFAQPVTGTVQIVGARRPRRVSQFTESRGVAARDLNQALTDIIAQNRETWDRTSDISGRAIMTAPGNVMAPLPPPASCANAFMLFDGTGLKPLCSTILGIPGTTFPVGTSGPTIPLNSGNNTSSGNNTYSGTSTFTNVATFLASLTGTNIDAQYIGDITYVTPQYCHYASLTGSPSSDNTACINNAIAAACANNAAGNHAGVLMFARGQYYTTGNSIPSTCSGLVLAGQGHGFPSQTPGPGGTTIVSDNSCSQPIVDFYADFTPAPFVTYVEGGGVMNMAFHNNSGSDSYGATSCKKPLIRVAHSELFRVQNIYGWQIYQLLQVNAGIHGLIENIFTDQGLQDSPGGIELTGAGALPDATGQTTRLDQFELRKIFLWGNEAPQVGHSLPVGLYIHGLAVSIKGFDTIFEYSSTALKIDCTPTAGGVAASNMTACSSYHYFYDLEAESGAPNGFNQVDITDAYSITLDTPYLSALGTGTANQAGINNNIFVHNTSFSTTSQITIKAAIQITGARASCINYQAGQLVLADSHIYNCNRDLNANVADLTLGAPSAKYFGSNSVHDNTFCMDNGGGSPGNENGISFASGTDYDDAHHNSFKGCGSGVIGTVGAHSISTPNVGP